MKRVLVFGTFDVIHDGHRHFLHEAKKLGDHVTIAVAQDHTAQKIKHRIPRRKMEVRISDLKNENLADEVIAGDVTLGTWNVIKNVKPDIIAFGYDQSKIKNILQKEIEKFDWPIEVFVLSAHQPEIFHSSLLNAEPKR